MSDDVGFDELRTERLALGEAVALHRASIRHFKHPDLPWFFLEPRETPRDEPVRHLSSSATCLESLVDVPDYRSEADQSADEITKEDHEVINAFAKAALESAPGRWQSDQAARVYCRVRTLTPVLRLASPDVVRQFGDVIREHVEFVWDRMDLTDPQRQGIAERPEPQEEDESNPTVRGLRAKVTELESAMREKGDGGDAQDMKYESTSAPAANEASPEEARVTYPPNAFHTYWAIRLLEEYARHDVPQLPDSVERKRAVAELWMKQTLSTQTGLIMDQAEQVDAHQLAWALALEFRHSHLGPVTASSPRLELYRTALKAFFSAQLGSGGWPLYQPLFHYPAAGNAYCYTFETLTELLRPALLERDGMVLRQLLRPHLRDLLRAWRYATRTAMDTGDGCRGWCSGHHPHRTDPEAWATAEVFSFLEILRRLVGHWACEEAATSLDARRPRAPTPERGKSLVRKRGDTWTQENEWTVGRRLAALFLHPLNALLQPQTELDPDRPLVESGGVIEQARSAILFGPPGVSKTTMVEGLAAAIGWHYVEIHAADFLSEGMDQVPARADQIFAQLMELDRCVVLFDEIDELIRQRQSNESDPFGRFLTTSMLPKLAKLWGQRRILYFVATNDIDAADPAIKRSQRFDAAIFAPPPSFAVKRDLLQEVLGQIPTSLSYEAVQDALSREWEQHCALGVFALLRYDQIPELAERLKPILAEKKVIDDLALKQELWEMGEGLSNLEWRHESGSSSGEPLDPFKLYGHYRKSERCDARMLQLFTLDSEPPATPSGTELFAVRSTRYYKIVEPFETVARTGEEGRWHLTVPEKWEARDDGLLEFKKVDADPGEQS